jgi:hypothetical protein
LAEAAEAKDGAASVPDLSPPDAGIGAVSDSAQDVGALTQFAQRLVAHLADRRPTDEPRLDVRGVRRGGRLVEVRVDPGVALRLCGDAVTTPRILRRWAALRWVRRVRPVFVLERRALDALDATLRRSLADACASEAGEKETVSTTPG